MMQYLPFADAKALAVDHVFERGAYQLVNAAAVGSLECRVGFMPARSSSSR